MHAYSLVNCLSFTFSDPSHQQRCRYHHHHPCQNNENERKPIFHAKAKRQHQDRDRTGTGFHFQIIIIFFNPFFLLFALAYFLLSTLLARKVVDLPFFKNHIIIISVILPRNVMYAKKYTHDFFISNLSHNIKRSLSFHPKRLVRKKMAESKSSACNAAA